MQNMRSRFELWFQPGMFLSASIHRPADTERALPMHVRARPVRIRGADLIQIATRMGPREQHANLSVPEAADRIAALLQEPFAHCEVATIQERHHIRRTRSGPIRVQSRPAPATLPSSAHDDEPNHLLPEGRPSTMLHSLGVMTADGRVVAAMRGKFRQINRFLEIARDACTELPRSANLYALDLACGKAYLTFALYHFLREIEGRSVEILGIDARSDLIADSAARAASLGYEGLRFAHQSIGEYCPDRQVDIVVALHACDTATDDALALAVRASARVILAAPCCQRSLRPGLRPQGLRALVRHPVLEERFAALATDALRAAWLETQGYSVRLIEFVDPEHTPKNLLLRATRNAARDVRRRTEEYRALLADLGLEQDPFSNR